MTNSDNKHCRIPKSGKRENIGNGCLASLKKHWIVLCAIAGLWVGFSPFCYARTDVDDFKTYKLHIDNENLRVAVFLPGGASLIEIDRLFNLRFKDNTWIGPDQMDAQMNQDDPGIFVFTNEQAEVQIRMVPEQDRVVFNGEVLCRKGVITQTELIGEFLLSGHPRTRFLWPRVLGNELFESFLSSNQKMEINYPHAFCDFCEATVASTPIYFYRSSYEEKPSACILTIVGGEPPVFRRTYRTYIRAGESWKCPATVCQVGGDLRETLLRYKRECSLGKTLKEKMTPEFYDRWVGMAEARVPEPVNSGYQVLKAFPMPAVIYIGNWMHGGFDGKYPDFLPPNNSYGGETGFQNFVQTAKKEGHLVHPYVNLTWWSVGWKNRNSEVIRYEPAPSLEKHGHIALSRDLNGELIENTWANGSFGYKSCPAHPLVVERNREVRDVLLDDYGVDFLYHDQLGALSWPLDLNPALENPAYYGSALMELGRDEAKRCPIATEWGTDRVLDFAFMLNYWALPPLSPKHVITGVTTATPRNQKRPRWVNGRSFPYALYLSSGDAVVKVRDCKYPAHLAWAMLLGGRISLGNVYWILSDGVDREAAIFLQQMANAIGEQTTGDRLMNFEYLADRVARSRFENHVVLANFSEKPWPVEDAIVAPSGFDLRTKDGFRAGRYLGTSKESILILMDPNKKTVTTLAPDGFEVHVGGLILKAKAPSVKKTQIHRKTAIIDFGENIIVSETEAMNVDTLAKVFSALYPQRIQSFDKLEEALEGNRVLINAQSGSFPVCAPADGPAAINRIRQWCEAGGIWVELDPWPMRTIVYPDPGGEPNKWKWNFIGQSGFENLFGERFQPVRRRGILPTPGVLHVIDLGRSVLSSKTINALERQSAIVTAPLEDSKNVFSLCENKDGDYIMIHTVGYGAIVRLGGAPVASAPEALSEIVSAILDDKLKLDWPVWRAPICREVKPVPAQGGKLRH